MLLDKIEDVNNRIGYLDGWRGIAIFFVLLGHFGPVSDDSWISFGRFGVDIFFVLSGLLMSKILFLKKTDLVTFYKRRISRIFPLSISYIAIIYSIAYLLNVPEYKNVLYTLTFTRNYMPFDSDMWKTGIPIEHLWSLAIEEQSYIYLSLVAAIFCRNRFITSAVLIFSGITCILLHYLYIKFNHHHEFNIQVRAEVAASPLLLSAGYYLIHDYFKPYVRSWMIVACFFFALLLYSDWSPHWTGRWSVTPFLLAFSVCHLDKLGGSILNTLNYSNLRKLGICSYSIYIWQQPLYFLQYNVFAHNLFTGILFLILAIVIGSYSYRYIENPSRTKLNEIWS